MNYVKCLPLKNLQDAEVIMKEVFDGNIVIASVGELKDECETQKIEILESKLATESQINGWDIALLGTFRYIICPKGTRVWRW